MDHVLSTVSSTPESSDVRPETSWCGLEDVITHLLHSVRSETKPYDSALYINLQRVKQDFVCFTCTAITR